MNLSKKLLTLLAIFCVIASAGVVCAADNDGGYVGIDYVDDMGDYAGSQYDDGGWAGSQYEDGGYAGSNYQDDGGWAGSQYNETAENAAANQTAPAAGEPTGTTNMTANATSSHTMLATGNPILILLGVSAVLGGAAVLRRKN
jgi:LPXTG-motif cell wall-anchored protein